MDRRAIEVLRQPLEDGVVQVSRVRGKFFYPARFMLVAAMNPCPCGKLYEGSGRCKCSSSAILKYRSRISGPVLDRIDLNIKVRGVKANELIFPAGREEESSHSIAMRVKKARDIQLERYRKNNETFLTNAAITPSKLAFYCKLRYQENILLEEYIRRQGISARGYTRILKIARTIADLDGSADINAMHLAEAVNLRCPEKDEMV